MVEEILGNGLCGLYYRPRRLVVLDSRLLDVQRRCTLCHELIHAEWDDAGCMGGGKAEIRARRLTAEALIDEDGYRRAEALYDGDAYAMACELNVTMQVLCDYRSLCLSRGSRLAV